MIIFWSKKCNGGYGDRLVGIGACIAMANILGHDFQVIWDEDLSDLFEDYRSSKPLPKVDSHHYLIDEKWVTSQIFATCDFMAWKGKTILIETNQPIHYQLWSNPTLTLTQSYAEVTREAYGSIYSKYMRIKPKWQNSLLNVEGWQGLQLRFGDYYMSGNTGVHYITPTRFKNLIETLKNVYDKETPIYLTTDYQQSCKALTEAFPQLRSYQHPSCHFDHTTNSRALTNIILEHYTLSRTQSIMTSTTSNFGLTAGLIGGVRELRLHHLSGNDTYEIEIQNPISYPRLKTLVPAELYQWSPQLHPIFPPRKAIYLICDRETYVYYEDYCRNLLNKVNLPIIIFNDASKLKIDNNCYYWFCNEIPASIMKDITEGRIAKSTITLLNTEQLTRPPHRKRIDELLAQGIQVIDYDLYQSAMTLSPDHYYLPYQITLPEWSKLRQLLCSVEKDYDVAFCFIGQSSRRQEIYDQLIAKGIKTLNVEGWGEARDRQLARAKLLLNVHYDSDYQIYEHMRCDRWVLAGQMVVTESSLSDQLSDVKDLLIIDQYDNLVSKVVAVLGDYETYRQQYQKTLNQQQSSIINQRCHWLCKLLFNKTSE